VRGVEKKFEMMASQGNVRSLVVDGSVGDEG
jgi:hypothetical protein